MQKLPAIEQTLFSSTFIFSEKMFYQQKKLKTYIYA